MPKDFLNITEFANRIGVSRKTVISWDNKGILKPHHRTPNGYRLYSEEQVSEFLSRKELPKTEPAFLTSRLFAEKIGVSQETVIAWDKKRLLTPHHKTPTGMRLYTREQVEEYLNNKNTTD